MDCERFRRALPCLRPRSGRETRSESAIRRWVGRAGTQSHGIAVRPFLPSSSPRAHPLVSRRLPPPPSASSLATTTCASLPRPRSAPLRARDLHRRVIRATGTIPTHAATSLPGVGERQCPPRLLSLREVRMRGRQRATMNASAQRLCARIPCAAYARYTVGAIGFAHNILPPRALIPIRPWRRGMYGT